MSTTKTPVELAIEAVCDKIRFCIRRADHQIPAYAWHDHKAACDMARRLNTIAGELDTALSSLKSMEPRKPINEECATTPIIGNVRERWVELGYNDPERASERFRDDPWKAWYNGWIEGRWPLMVGAGKQDAVSMAVRFHEAYERLAPSFGYTTRTDTRAFDPESPNGKLMIAVCNEILQSAKP